MKIITLLNLVRADICRTRMSERVSIHKCENTVTHATLMDNLLFFCEDYRCLRCDSWWGGNYEPS
jgi:hypothetical protein